MKHSLIIITILCLATSIVFSQTNKKEVGVGISLIDFPNSFSLAFKLQKSETKWFRLNAVLGTVQFQKNLDLPNNTSDVVPLNTAFGLSLGLEKRKTFNRVDILRGPQFEIGMAMSTLIGDNVNVDPSIGIYGGLSYLFGVQVHIKNGIKIGVETMPGARVNYVNNGTSDKTLDFNLGFNSNALNLFLVYQFGRNKETE